MLSTIRYIQDVFTQNERRPITLLRERKRQSEGRAETASGLTTPVISDVYQTTPWFGKILKYLVTFRRGNYGAIVGISPRPDCYCQCRICFAVDPNDPLVRSGPLDFSEIGSIIIDASVGSYGDRVEIIVDFPYSDVLEGWWKPQRLFRYHYRGTTCWSCCYGTLR